MIIDSFVRRTKLVFNFFMFSPSKKLSKVLVTIQWYHSSELLELSERASKLFFSEPMEIVQIANKEEMGYNLLSEFRMRMADR